MKNKPLNSIHERRKCTEIPILVQQIGNDEDAQQLLEEGLWIC